MLEEKKKVVSKHDKIVSQFNKYFKDITKGLDIKR